MTPFESRIQALAEAAGLKLATLDGPLATLNFQMETGRKRVVVIDFDQHWEFSCRLFTVESDIGFSRDMLTQLLLANAHSNRAFWALEQGDDGLALEAQANFPEAHLSAAEFRLLVEAPLHMVVSYERFLRQQ